MQYQARNENPQKNSYVFRKLSLNTKTEIVKSVFSDKGLTISSDWQYKGNSYLIPFTCSKGHKHSVSYANFSKGVGCVYCSTRPPKTSEIVRKEFADSGLTIQKNWNYKNAKTLIPFTCMNGHNHALTYNKFQQGQRCMYCIGTPKYSSEYIRNVFFSKGLSIPENWDYEDIKTPIPFTCLGGHSHQISYTNLKKGQGCIYCYSESTVSILKERTRKYGIQRIVQRTLETASGKAHNRTALLNWVESNISQEVIELYIQNSTIKFNIDHVIPLSWFNLAEETELKAAWSIHNLQILSIVDNKKKGNKLTDSQLKNLSEAQKEILNQASLKPEYATIQSK